mmetsp:Transcript_291/g.394  ORF Transcript_291/g.394 Transcript_291/m.394 type:complete len:213 (-) Transcript_291:262-900(-)
MGGFAGVFALGLTVLVAQEAPPPTGVFLGPQPLVADFSFSSMILSAIPRSGNNSSLLTSKFCCADAPRPIRILGRPEPWARIRAETQIPPAVPVLAVAAALAASFSLASFSFRSFSALTCAACRSIPSRAAASLALVSSTFNFAAILSEPLDCAKFFMSITSVVAVFVAGVVLLRVTTAASSHCWSSSAGSCSLSVTTGAPSAAGEAGTGAF